MPTLAATNAVVDLYGSALRTGCELHCVCSPDNTARQAPYDCCRQLTWQLHCALPAAADWGGVQAQPVQRHPDRRPGVQPGSSSTAGTHPAAVPRAAPGCHACRSMPSGSPARRSIWARAAARVSGCCAAAAGGAVIAAAVCRRHRCCICQVVHDRGWGDAWRQGHACYGCGQDLGVAQAHLVGGQLRQRIKHLRGSSNTWGSTQSLSLHAVRCGSCCCCCSSLTVQQSKPSSCVW